MSYTEFSKKIYKEKIFFLSIIGTILLLPLVYSIFTYKINIKYDTSSYIETESNEQLPYCEKFSISGNPVITNCTFADYTKEKYMELVIFILFLPFLLKVLIFSHPGYTLIILFIIFVLIMIYKKYEKNIQTEKENKI